MHIVEAVLGLLVLAVAVAAVAHRLRTPAPSLLVLAGLGVGYLPGLPTLDISPRLITLGVLPPLLFAAAQQVSLQDLAAVWRPVAVLAVGLVAVSAAAVAFVAHGLDSSISLATAFTLGAILASTDPVAVTALSRELRLPERIATLVQSESLFNDATSLVLFQVAVTAVTAGTTSVGGDVLRFVQIGGGGLALGLVVGQLSGLLLRRGGEPSLQAAVALITPYVAAVVAEQAQVSSVTAVIVTGLMLARRRGATIPPAGRLMATSVYDTVVLLLENAIFAVIGLELAGFIRALPSGDGATAGALIAVVTATLLLVRGVGLGAAAISPRRRERPGISGAAPWRTAAVVTWAGARGVIPLAAALSVPLTVDDGTAFPHRPLVLLTSTAAVVVTLVVQGTTLGPLVRRLGVVGDVGVLHDQRGRARLAVATAALDHLAEVAESVDAPAASVDRLRAELNERVERARAVLHDEGAAASWQRGGELRRRLIEVQAEELARLRAAGEISSEVFREVQRQLDLEAARLRP